MVQLLLCACVCVFVPMHVSMYLCVHACPYVCAHIKGVSTHMQGDSFTNASTGDDVRQASSFWKFVRHSLG